MIRTWMRATGVVAGKRMSRVAHAGAVHVGQAGLLAVGVRQPAEKMVEAAVLHGHDDDVLDARIFRTWQSWKRQLREEILSGEKRRTDQCCARNKRGILQQFPAIDFHEVTP